jgi:hypothetical protein
VLGGSLYHVGGRDLFFPQRYMEKYDAARDEWQVVCVGWVAGSVCVNGDEWEVVCVG